MLAAEEVPEAATTQVPVVKATGGAVAARRLPVAAVPVPVLAMVQAVAARRLPVVAVPVPGLASVPAAEEEVPAARRRAAVAAL